MSVDSTIHPNVNANLGTGLPNPAGGGLPNPAGGLPNPAGGPPNPAGGLNGGIPGGGLSAGIPSGGLSTPGFQGAAPTQFGNAGGAISNVNNTSVDEIKIIGYIAPTCNCIKDTISSKRAKELYNQAYTAYIADPEKSKVMTKTALKADGTEKLKKKATYQVELNKKFSMDCLNTFFPEVVKQLKDEHKKSIDLSEARVAYFIVRNDAQEATRLQSLGAALANAGYTAQTDDNTLRVVIIKPQQLLSFMGSQFIYEIPVFVRDEKVGIVFANEGRVPTSGDKERNINLIYIRTPQGQDPVKASNLRSMCNAAGEHVPYAIFARNVVASNAPVASADDILNLETYLKLFPDKTAEDAKKLPVRLSIKKESFNGDDEKYKEAKAKERITFEEQQAVLESMGVVKACYDKLTTTSGTKKINLFTIRQNAQKAVQAIQARNQK